MSHLVKVDDCEAVCLSGPHVLHTEEEPLCVLVCVEIKTKIEFIVPSTTGGGAGAGGEEREAWRGREREGGMREEEGNITIWMVTHHSHIPLTLPHSTHTHTPTHTPTLHSHLHSLCEVATLKPRLKHQGCALRRKGGCGLWGHAGTSSGTSKLYKRCKPSTTH